MLAGNIKGAIPFDRPRQRAQVAVEFHLLEHETGVARGVDEHGTAVLDIQALDRNRFEIEAKLRDRPGQLAGRIKPGREFGTFQPRVGDAPCAPHQGPERKLDA